MRLVRCALRPELKASWGASAGRVIEALRDCGFRPPGRVTFLLLPQQESNQRKRAPRHPALRFASGSLLPVPLQGPAYTGHPWPAMPCTAVLAAYPLRVTSTRPSARGFLHRGADGFMLMPYPRIRPGASFPATSKPVSANKLVQVLEQRSGNFGPQSPTGGRVQALRRR